MPTHAQQQTASQQTSVSKAAPAAPAGMQLEQGFEIAEVLDLQQTAGNHAVQRLLTEPGAADTPVRSRISQPAVMRDDDDPVPITGVNLNHRLVTTPPTAGLSLTASAVPSNATDVEFSLEAGTATLDGGTSIDASTGVITISGSQTGGSVNAKGTQEDGAAASLPFYMAGVPAGISSTTSLSTGDASLYGGEFWHTFNSPGGGQQALDRVRVNEHFAAASGNRLNLSGGLGSVGVGVNAANAAGWPLDATGQMTEADNVDWGIGESAAPLIARASNPTPANPLPQELNATQEFRNMEFPAETFGSTAVASVVHRRAYEERNGEIVAVTSVNGEEIVNDYVGATVFRNASASETTLQATAPAAEGEEAAEGATSQIAVEVVGRDQTPQFWIHGANHGCSVNRTTGVFTAGSEAGEVVVRAGRTGNYDAVTITITAPPGGESTETATDEETVETAAPEE